MDDIHRLLLFGIFGTISAIFLFLAPVITFNRIAKNRSTEKFSGLPYVMTLFYCLVSAWNGQLAFSFPHNIVISIINCIGAVIETIYVLIFIKFAATKEEKTKIIWLFTFVLTLFFALVIISHFALHGENKTLLFGFSIAIASIIMYSLPFSIMRLVIKTKSVEFMPFFLSLSLFLYGICWHFFPPPTIIGIFHITGSALAVLQLVLYCIIYVYQEKVGSKRATEEEKSMETKLYNANGAQEGQV